MANLGLLGALAGAGQAMSNFGADLIRRREAALAWAQKEAEYQRARADKKEDIATEFGQQKEITTMRETAADERNRADIEARAAEKAKDRTFQAEDREDTQTFELRKQREQQAATLEREKIIESLKQSNSEKDTKLRHELEGQDVQGVKYGLRYNAQGKRDDNSPYTELLKVLKNGQIVHTGKLILAPQNRSGQDDENAL